MTASPARFHQRSPTADARSRAAVAGLWGLGSAASRSTQAADPLRPDSSDDLVTRSSATAPTVGVAHTSRSPASLDDLLTGLEALHIQAIADPTDCRSLEVARLATPSAMVASRLAADR